MRKVFLTATLCTLVCIVSPTLAFQPTAIDPHVELLTPGVTRNFTITQFNNFPQDFSFFLVVLIGYGPVSINLSSSAASTEGDLFVISGLGMSAAGIIPFLKFGRADVNLAVGIEIGNERSPYGLLWFSSWIASPIEEETTYDLSIRF
jgi:hypothetical protein